MRTLRYAFLLPALLIAAAPAQTKSATWRKSVGGGTGVDMELAATLSFDKDPAGYGLYHKRAEGDAHAVVDVKLFGSSREAAYAGGSVYANQRLAVVDVGATPPVGYYSLTGGGEAALRLGGRTIWSLPDWESSGTATKTLTKDLGPYNVFTTDPSTVVWVGPVPVTIRGNVGAQGELEFMLRTVPSNARIEVGGTASGYAYGWARATVGVLCAYAGIEVDLRFGNVEIGPVLEADADGVHGYFDYAMTAIKLTVKLVVSWCLGSDSYTLFNKSSPTVSNRKTLL